MKLRLFSLTLVGLWWLLLAGPALAQQPITLTGQIEDQDPVTGLTVTRAATFTLIYTPTVAYPHSSYVYTSTGNSFVLERRATYGELLSGAGSLLLLQLAVLVLGMLVARRRL